MEILIPGLILVALMVYASTRIKKRAAEAFEPEAIETEEFSLLKPEGFLHVIGSTDHDFEAYSKDFPEDNSGQRRGKIEVDVLRGMDLRGACDSVRESADRFEVVSESDGTIRVETEESANEIPIKAFYKLIGSGDRVYRLRFAVLRKQADDYLRRIDETLDSFRLNNL